MSSPAALSVAGAYALSIRPSASRLLPQRSSAPAPPPPCTGASLERGIISRTGPGQGARLPRKPNRSSYRGFRSRSLRAAPEKEEWAHGSKGSGGGERESQETGEKPGSRGTKTEVVAVEDALKGEGEDGAGRVAPLGGKGEDESQGEGAGARRVLAEGDRMWPQSEVSPAEKVEVSSAEKVEVSSAEKVERAEERRGEREVDGKGIKQEEHEKDWKHDPDFQKFMGDSSIEAALRLERKRVEERLWRLEREDSERSPGFFQGLTRRVSRWALQREKDNIEKNAARYHALDISKLSECFSFNNFFSTKARRFGDGAIFVGNLRAPIAEVRPRLESALEKAAGRPVDVWFLQEEQDGNIKQAVLVQPSDEVAALGWGPGGASVGSGEGSGGGAWVYLGAVALAITTAASTAYLTGFLQPQTQDLGSFLDREALFLGGFLLIGGVSEAVTRGVARAHRVQLGPTALIPSNWTGCFGAFNRIESILPNRTALFDVALARLASSYGASLSLAVAAALSEGGLEGGSRAMYLRPLLLANPLFSFLEYVVGPYADDLGNVLPRAVAGMGVPVHPLALAGLLGVVITSLNALPYGSLEGGRMVQALWGRRVARATSTATILALLIYGSTASSPFLAWAGLCLLLRSGSEVPAKDEISDIGAWRYNVAVLVFILCAFTLLPNTAGIFPSPFHSSSF